MHLYSTEGRITKYNTIDDILKEYYIKRLQLYEDRRKYQLDELKRELDIISNKTRFILMVVNDELVVNKRKRSDLEKDLEKNKFPKSSYDYLLALPIYNLTFEKIEELKKQEQEKESQYKLLNKKTADSIWKEELVELKNSLESSDIKPASKKKK